MGHGVRKTFRAVLVLLTHRTYPLVLTVFSTARNDVPACGKSSFILSLLSGLEKEGSGSIGTGEEGSGGDGMAVGWDRGCV